MLSINNMTDITSPFIVTGPDYFASFHRIGNQLLHGTTLLVNGKGIRITEIEFYYNSAEHPDVFTHGDPLQNTVGRWYFHRKG